MERSIGRYNVDQHGVEMNTAGWVWTGSTINGTGTNSGILLGTPPYPVAGRLGWTNDQWVFDRGLNIGSSRHVFAISGSLTAVPEPSAILCLGLVGLGLAGRRRLKNSK